MFIFGKRFLIYQCSQLLSFTPSCATEMSLFRGKSKDTWHTNNRNLSSAKFRPFLHCKYDCICMHFSTADFLPTDCDAFKISKLVLFSYVYYSATALFFHNHPIQKWLEKLMQFIWGSRLNQKCKKTVLYTRLWSWTRIHSNSAICGVLRLSGYKALITRVRNDWKCACKLLERYITTAVP